MPSEIQTQGIPHKKLAPVLDKLRERVFKHEVIQDLFDEYDLYEEELELIPMCFAKLPVSARTDHGVIYINIDLIRDGGIVEDDHYLAHEPTHFAQQTTGNKPTPGSDADDYLDNPIEQEAFRNQTRYLSDTRGDEAAEMYIDQVLDHHDSDGKKREKRRKKLLELAHEVSRFSKKSG